MKTVFSDDHRLHFPQGELHGGEFVTPFERPEVDPIGGTT